MNNAGIGVKSIDDRMVTTVSLVMTQLLQVSRRGRGGEQHKVWWRRAIITDRKHDVQPFSSSIAATTVSVVGAADRTLLLPPGSCRHFSHRPRRNRKQRQACSALHHSNVFTTLPPPPPPPPHHNYLTICLTAPPHLRITARMF